MTAETAQVVLPTVADRARLRPLDGGVLIRFGGETMGTGFQVSAVVADAGQQPALEARVTRAFRTVIAQMSQWEPGSELTRFNAGAAGSWHDLSPGGATCGGSARRRRPTANPMPARGPPPGLP